MIHCWAPLEQVFDDTNALHAKASEQLERLIPNMATHVPDDIEEEPSSDADDDYERSQCRKMRARSKDAQRLSARNMRALPMPTALPPSARPSRAATAAANAAMDAMDARGELE